MAEVELTTIGTGEAARMLRRSTQSIRNYIRRGDLPAVRLGDAGAFVMFNLDVLDLAEKLKPRGSLKASRRRRK